MRRKARREKHYPERAAAVVTAKTKARLLRAVEAHDVSESALLRRVIERGLPLELAAMRRADAKAKADEADE